LGLSLLDRYVLRLAAAPMTACLVATMLTFVGERTLVLLQVLSPTDAGFGALLKLTASLVPHFLGLTLPVAFFVALFIVITRLDGGSEIAAMLAGGRSLYRIVAPLICVAILLNIFGIVLFGYLQPYSRYAYRSAFHEATNSGWNGQLEPGQIISSGSDLIMAEAALPGGHGLQRIFIRRTVGGGEDVITASSAELYDDPEGKTTDMVLHDGTQFRARKSRVSILSFQTFAIKVPLTGALKLLRARGGDQRELTLGELVREAGRARPFLPRNTLMAEFYARLARSFVLPLLPLLAFPLGLAAKRAGRAPGLVTAGVLLLAFEYGIQFGESFAKADLVPAGLAIGVPFSLFAAFCIWMFMGSGRRPGETPLTLALQTLGEGMSTLLRRLGRDPAADGQAI
jgi:lipopolysaccharide export system permease protein